MIFLRDTLKIDISFVQNILEDEKCKLITQVIIFLGKHLNLRAVAEGAENEEQVRMLKELRCKAVQWYCFIKLVNASKFGKNFGTWCFHPCIIREIHLFSTHKEVLSWSAVVKQSGMLVQQMKY